MKSLSVKPLILCVQVVISTFPQASEMSGWCPCSSASSPYAVYEREGSAKVGKREGLRDVVPLNHIPSVDLPLQRGEFLTL
jgi:hypothetical protein